MKLHHVRGRFEVLPISIKYIDEKDNLEKNETLNIKYRPIKSDWFASVEQTEKELDQIKNETVERLQGIAELIKTQQELKDRLDSIGESSADESDKKQAQAEYDKHIKLVEKERDLLEKFLEESKEATSTVLAKKLLPVLVDLDMTDEGQPVKPSLEVLNSLDYELLLEILTGIKKKMSQ